MAEEDTEMADWGCWISGLDKKELLTVLFFVFIILIIFKNLGKEIEVQGKRKNLSTLNYFIAPNLGRLHLIHDLYLVF